MKIYMIEKKINLFYFIYFKLTNSYHNRITNGLMLKLNILLCLLFLQNCTNCNFN